METPAQTRPCVAALDSAADGSASTSADGNEQRRAYSSSDDDVDELQEYWGVDTDSDLHGAALVFTSCSERQGERMFRRFLRGAFAVHLHIYVSCVDCSGVRARRVPRSLSARLRVRPGKLARASEFRIQA
jgi:hypothetical protein